MKETVWKWTARSAGAAILSGLALTGSAFAQEASEVSAYVDNSYLFLISGMVVMFMAAGFCMLEVGLVRSKNAATQSVKNIMIYSVAGIMVYLVGYHLIYPAESWLIEGVLASPDWLWNEGDREALDGAGYAPASDWYFQMVFVATAASVVSGTVAERVKLLPFMIFTAVLTGFIYPIQASWQWGGGWLSELGFADFAGSTLVHSTGGWAALVGAIILGPRAGKYVDGKVNPMPGSNIPLAALGTFILWLGWFGFNGGSQLAAGTAADINAVSIIFANTNLAAAGGVVAAAILTPIFFKKMDPTIVMNGAIGGLVAITAEPLAPALWESILIGAVGGAIIVFFVPLLDKLKIDDVVGAIPAHLVAGIFGTLVVAWNGGDIVAQATGVVAIGAFVIVTSAVTWLLLKFTIGIRCSEEEEMEGIDKVELGLEAYPEFSK
ncbi:ammonium transporter [Ponticaulis sp.]|mgnify:CR=1 FL=1|jgi:Amt family ammonium transporter|uniref:ammonium transporter n=1 Tax=Ponticaulis sp. TaxID=2020902 RepID=UPI000B6985D5|nr:ammonium transporter [Ponticaulis sp.]MAJ07838.1 ammonium transporter [Ponticaulis sp.]RPG18154.1 MAG: ammonium transporter [Hyphomonadaceae bacterium TMED125]|tara:strand:+ start:1101 stop:2411 length:1311 start_codon:yes stop_codon:yes gene_type:complete